MSLVNLIRILSYSWIVVLSLMSCDSQEIPVQSQVPEPQSSIKPEQETPDGALRDQLSISEAMEICGNKLSEARKNILSQQISRIANQWLHNPQHVQAFIGLLCIESKFDNTARSSVGAVGIAQIMPKYASYFAEECGLGKADASDLQDTEINLTIGACHFSKLIESLNGNIALALSGYNSGQDSETTKRLSKLAEGHPETMAYISKFYTYINKLQLAQESHSRNK